MVVSKLNLQRYCIEGPFLNNVFIDFLFDYDQKKGCLKNLVYSGSLLGDTELWFTDYVDGELNGSRNEGESCSNSHYAPWARKTPAMFLSRHLGQCILDVQLSAFLQEL